ncbi:hypothetical protein BamIOP4010DRAFT_4824 [Burkholderia ambifaria IOP40-10]|uniref:Uncharacterized protein n=1 Tax=Burkholderia ambifaria IOP40-10 TaxID=396596 RepID=B1FLB3_9BURK|nr:hypothetical protein BamIOP4010DRAFT_4824 [Burkholderia ambifaria IOP40-10]
MAEPGIRRLAGLCPDHAQYAASEMGETGPWESTSI